MSLLVNGILGATAAMVGGAVGLVLHELTHYVVAKALTDARFVIGSADGMILSAGVDFRADSRIKSELIRKSPLVVGLCAAGYVGLRYDGLSVAWVFLAGVVVGLLQLSKEDLFVSAADQTDPTEVNA
jgi:hypothetical protein